MKCCFALWVGICCGVAVFVRRVPGVCLGLFVLLAGYVDAARGSLCITLRQLLFGVGSFLAVKKSRLEVALCYCKSEMFASELFPSGRDIVKRNLDWATPVFSACKSLC